MRNKICPAFIAISFAGALLFAADSAEQLVIKKCSPCHTLDNLCKHLGTDDSAAWTRIVDSMIKKGALVNGDEKKMISEYLAGLKAGSKPYCK